MDLKLRSYRSDPKVSPWLMQALPGPCVFPAAVTCITQITLHVFSLT